MYLLSRIHLRMARPSKQMRLLTCISEQRYSESNYICRLLLCSFLKWNCLLLTSFTVKHSRSSIFLLQISITVTLPWVEAQLENLDFPKDYPQNPQLSTSFLDNNHNGNTIEGDRRFRPLEPGATSSDPASNFDPLGPRK